MRLRICAALLLAVVVLAARVEAQQAWIDKTDSMLIQTDDATPTAMFTIPVDVLKVAIVEVTMVAVSPDFSNGLAQSGSALFARNTGNVTRLFQTIGGSLTNWGNPQPTFSINANAATQSIEVVVTGKAATAVRWYLSIRYRITV